jgi:nucleoside-diphosphate-sugar epimerase
LSQPVHVIGATGRTGAALCRALAERGRKVVPVIRNPTKWAATGLPGQPVIAPADDPAALRQALERAEVVVSTAHASYAAAILAAAPTAHLVLLGSTRRFSQVDDDHGRGVRAGEAALLNSGRPGVMLHPSMIYGGPDDGTVRRLAALLHRSRILPLPGGGRSLVQPIHRGDVIRAIIAAIDYRCSGPHAMVIAGPVPLPYAAFARAVAAALALPAPLIMPIPLAPLLVLARLATRIPGLPQVGPEEIRRLTEDKDFPISDMVDRLGVTPISLNEGLAQEFAGPQNETRNFAQESAPSCP